MVHMARQHIALGFTLPRKSKLSLCEGCIFGKLSNSPFPSHQTTTTKPLQLVHTDICGPLSTPSLSGNVYFLTFIDDFTRFTMVTFLKTKRSDQVLEKFKFYHKLVTNQQDLPLKVLQSDNGGEFKSEHFQNYCQNHGIQQRFTICYTHQHNSRVERRNRLYMDATRSMLAIANLPRTYWEEVVSTACHIFNRIYGRSIRTTPFSLWFGKIQIMKT